MDRRSFCLAVSAALHAAVVRTARNPSIESAYQAAGNRATPSETPKEFADFVRSRKG